MTEGRMKFTNEIVWSTPEGATVEGVLHAVTCRVNRNGKYYAWLIDDGERCVNYVFNDTLYHMCKVGVTLGSSVAVTYRGKQEMSGGKTMKIYDLEVLVPNEAGEPLYEMVQEIDEEKEGGDADNGSKNGEA